jgi:hypothetical protein
VAVKFGISNQSAKTMNLQLKETAYPHNPIKLGIAVAIAQLVGSAGFLVVVLSVVFSQPKTGESESQKAQRQAVACAVGENAPGSRCEIVNFRR